MISKGELKQISLTAAFQGLSGYPYDLPAFKNLDVLPLHRKVTFFAGENGMGKSTFLEAIALANGFNAEGGTRNFNFSTRSSHSDLDKYLMISRGIHRLTDGFFLRSESFFNVATEIENLDAEPSPGKIIDAYGGRSLHEQSHGESFWSLFMNRFSGNGLYLLDEPEAALSVTRQMAMLLRMHELTDQNSQFIIVTHSPIILAYPDCLIYEFSESGIKEVDYIHTETYQIFKRFMTDHKGVLDILLGDTGKAGF